jgi:lysophospholipase L1-like esterase/RimJ/RimL family protein N-acetyltransferase
MITLETERLILKPIQLSDAEAIFHFFTKEVTTYMLPAPAKKIEDTESFINSAIKAREAHEEIVWVARLKYDDTFVGCMGLHKMNTDTPELGLWIQEGLFGKKLGLEGIKGIVKYAREHVPHHYLIYPVDRRNISSRNIPETLGGIVKKHYPKESASGSVLDIIEYWIYPETPQDFKPLTVLFQGDSITDCGRNRHDLASLGDGYVYQLKQSLPMVNVINKGISGDRTAELLARWQDDVIAYQPDVLSLLCGVNDVWHYFNFGKPIDEETFESNYRKLIHMTKEQSPHTKMFLIEPFSFSIGAFDASWRPMLNSFINIVAKLAKEENLPLIHMDEHMKSWEKTYGAAALCGDGVHPTELGHQLMASVLKPVIRNLLLEIDLKKL